MADKVKTVKASSIRTRAQFDRACREGWNVIFDEPYPQAPSNRPKKARDSRKKK